MRKEKEIKKPNKNEKPVKSPDTRASEDIDDFIFEEEGYKCSEK